MSYVEGEVMRLPPPSSINMLQASVQHLGYPLMPLFATPLISFPRLWIFWLPWLLHDLQAHVATLTRVKYAVTHLHNCRYSDLYLLPTNHSLLATMHLLERTGTGKAKSSLDRMSRVSELHV